MSKVSYHSHLVSAEKIQKQLNVKCIVVLIDKKLKNHAFVRQWLRGFEKIIFLNAGEKLKSISSFEIQTKKILQLTEGYARDEVALLAVGGGSVGDFTGFVASVLRRGVIFANIPSTWLAAVDSAHGGKTALNLDSAKNQIGTFYPAQQVWICRNLLESSGDKNQKSVMGEVLKTLFYTGGSVYKKYSKQLRQNKFQLWKALPDLVNAKMKIVSRDFDESKGLRHILNLGHSLGHIIEVSHKLPHGLAVLAGLEFAVEWSFYRKLMKTKTYLELMLLFDLQPTQSIHLTASSVKKLLLKDKKSSNGKLRFVFLKSPGRPLVQKVSVVEFLSECRRQGITA